ncbi:hypothetical protein DFH28DRAFT_309327 [Melampsora americana]|nr:hypothetical protein DFH28DRAFT_309327 [Melampsora americana]
MIQFNSFPFFFLINLFYTNFSLNQVSAIPLKNSIIQLLPQLCPHSHSNSTSNSTSIIRNELIQKDLISNIKTNPLTLNTSINFNFTKSDVVNLIESSEEMNENSMIHHGKPFLSTPSSSASFNLLLILVVMLCLYYIGVVSFCLYHNESQSFDLSGDQKGQNWHI